MSQPSVSGSSGPGAPRVNRLRRLERDYARHHALNGRVAGAGTAPRHAISAPRNAIRGLLDQPSSAGSARTLPLVERRLR